MAARSTEAGEWGRGHCLAWCVVDIFIVFIIVIIMFIDVIIIIQRSTVDRAGKIQTLQATKPVVPVHCRQEGS